MLIPLYISTNKYLKKIFYIINKCSHLFFLQTLCLYFKYYSIAKKRSFRIQLVSHDF
jgi:hypothetical protein